jgi:hypothetical protein
VSVGWLRNGRDIGTVAARLAPDGSCKWEITDWMYEISEDEARPMFAACDVLLKKLLSILTAIDLWVT